MKNTVKKSGDGGRPTTFSTKIADQICDWIAEGKSLASFCRTKKIGYSTVMQWLGAHPKFAEDYARARVDSGDAEADTVTDIRERMLRGEITPEMARVAIDAAKWSAGKRQPKRYGDKLEIDQTTRTAPMTGEQLQAEMAQSPAFRREIEELLAKAKEGQGSKD